MNGSHLQKQWLIRIALSLGVGVVALLYAFDIDVGFLWGGSTAETPEIPQVTPSDIFSSESNQIRMRYSGLDPQPVPTPAVAPRTKEISKEVHEFIAHVHLRTLERAERAQLAGPTHWQVNQERIDARRKRESELQSVQLVKYRLMEGTVIPIRFLTAVTSDVKGPVVAEVVRPVYATKGPIVVPQGSRVIGNFNEVSVTYGMERLPIVWTRIIFPNQSSVDLSTMIGADEQGRAGFAGRVNNHWGPVLASVFVTSALSASARMATGRRYRYEERWDELAAEGAVDNVNRVGQRVAGRALKIPPTIELEPGMRGNIFIARDLELRAYAL